MRRLSKNSWHVSEEHRLSFTRFRAEIIGQAMVPLSILGKLRHDLVRSLEEAAVAFPIRHLNPGYRQVDRNRERSETSNDPTLHVLCRSLEQLTEVLALNEKNLYVEFQDIREYQKAIDAAHAAGATIFLATPRIQKPDEMGIFQLLRKQKPDGILVRNFGGLRFFTRIQFRLLATFRSTSPILFRPSSSLKKASLA